MTENQKRLADLASQSYAKNIFTYSDFLSESSLAEMEFMKFPVEYEVWGGADFASRKMVRFGGLNSYGSGEYPLEILKISPKSSKFAVEISHRDILGAVMNLGVVREKIGDIFCGGKEAFLVCDSKILVYLLENLTKASKNSVYAESAFEVPSSFVPKTESERISVASPRVDSVICKLYNLSREGCLELFRTGKISVNSKICENNSKILLVSDVVSARGYGKFKFCGESGVSRKGKTYIEIEKFI